MSDIKITVQDRVGRRCASSGSKWEPIMGYSRAVRSGNTIAVTGCVGINADGTYAKTVGEQTARSLAIIQAAIEALGGKMEHVIRTRMFVTEREPMGRSRPRPRQRLQRNPPGHDDRRSRPTDRRRRADRNRSRRDYRLAWPATTNAADHYGSYEHCQAGALGNGST